MSDIGELIWIFHLTPLFIGFVIIIFLIFRRIKKREEEDFEKRDN